MLFIIKFANTEQESNNICLSIRLEITSCNNGSEGIFPQEFFYGLDHFKNIFNKQEIIEFDNREYRNIRYFISLFLEKISGLPFFMQKIINLENYKIFKIQKL